MIGIELLVLFLASLGLINILIYSPLAKGFRGKIVGVFSRFGKEEVGQYLTKCPTCLGFWVGVLMTGVWFSGLVWFTLPFAISFLGLLGSLFWFPID